MRETPIPNDPVLIGNSPCDRLAYADDVDLMGEYFILRDHQVLSFRNNSRRIGLEAKEAKTKAMVQSRVGRDVDFVDIGDLLIEVVDHFKYLGSHISHDNTIDMELHARTTSANKAFWSLNDIFKSKSVSHALKIQLYTCIIRPIATYGCETWTLTKRHEAKLDVFQNSILRRIYGPIFDEEVQAWRMRHNAELRERSRLPLLSGYVRSMRLRWAGHVARMDEASLCRQVMEGRPLGRRPVGRPRLRWQDTVVSDLRLLGIVNPNDWIQLAQDRRGWRNLVLAAKDPHGLQPRE